MWMKKDGLFNVTMRAYDRAEVCQLVGTFLLDSISVKYDKNRIGLCRDYGLSVFKKSGTQLEKIKKSLQKSFKDFPWKIVAESNLRIVNSLDVTLNINGGSFGPCHKPYDITQYINNKESNHPPNLNKHLSASIEKRLSNNSSDEKLFKELAIYYEDTLNKAGYIGDEFTTLQAQVTRKTKAKIANGTLYGLIHYIVKVSQRE